LSRAGKRLMGFCRTNLFKRLESGGPAFIQSIDRHILRNYIFLHAIDHDLPVPLGTQGAELLDAAYDEDPDATLATSVEDDDDTDDGSAPGAEGPSSQSDEAYHLRAAEAYDAYATQYKRRFTWLRPSLFDAALKADLLADARALIDVLKTCGTWGP